jgi:hypothetical protein
MNNLDIYNKYREVPKEAQKPIQGGRMKGKTDINPMWRIKALTEQFGPCGIGWYYKPIKKWLEQHGDEIAAFVDIELFIKIDGEWSMPISGTGGSMFVTVEKSGVYVSDECYKMATTDAISVACKQLGFGADIYWGADSSKYDVMGEGKEEKGTMPAISKRDELLGLFHKEIQRTGKSLKWFLDNSNVSDAKYIKTTDLNKYLEILKTLPDKG